jgi:cytochrome c peroxidase
MRSTSSARGVLRVVSQTLAVIGVPTPRRLEPRGRDEALFTDGVSNEIRANNVANVQARGSLGFNVPSLIAVFASAPYLHSGAAPTLDAVLANVTHRSIGRPDQLDTLTNPQDRAALVQFLKSIDRNTVPFLNVNPPADACGPP